MQANRLRLWFASFTYLLLDALCRIGLRFTQVAIATCGTIRLKLSKIRAQDRRAWSKFMERSALVSALSYAISEEVMQGDVTCLSHPGFWS
jgi:hypothetical protein